MVQLLDNELLKYEKDEYSEFWNGVILFLLLLMKK